MSLVFEKMDVIREEYRARGMVTPTSLVVFEEAQRSLSSEAAYEQRGTTSDTNRTNSYFNKRSSKGNDRMSIRSAGAYAGTQGRGGADEVEREDIRSPSSTQLSPEPPISPVYSTSISANITRSYASIASNVHAVLASGDYAVCNFGDTVEDQARWLQTYANEVASTLSTKKIEEDTPRPRAAGGNLDEELKLLESRLSKLEQTPATSAAYGDGQQLENNIGGSSSVIANSGYTSSPPSGSTRQAQQWSPYQQRPYGKPSQCGYCRSNGHTAANCEFYLPVEQLANTGALAQIEPYKAESILNRMFSEGVLQYLCEAKDVQDRIRKEVMDKRATLLADKQPVTGGKLTNPPTPSKTVTFGKGGDKSDEGAGTK